MSTTAEAESFEDETGAALASKEANIETSAEAENFTISQNDAHAQGIDIQSYVKVDTLPAGSNLTAIASIWGDEQNIFCLFETEGGDKLMRVVSNQGPQGYLIIELGSDAQKIKSGERFTIG